MRMKKKIRLLAVCAIMLCGMIVGGIAKPAEVMDKTNDQGNKGNERCAEDSVG